MTHPNKSVMQPELLLELDSQLGPAEPLTDDQERLLVASVMGRTDLLRPDTRRGARRRRGSRGWAVGLLLLAVAAAAAVAARSFETSNAPASDPEPAPAHQ